MVFRRRDRPPFLTRVRELVYPRTGWKRAIEYIGHRIRRIPDTPHRIALGFACGVMASFNPLFGLHFVIAVALAWAVRGNLLAAMVGTFVGNPLTFPLIASVSLPLGRRILGHGASGRDFTRVSEAFAGAVDGLLKGIGSLFGYGAPEWGKLWTLAADVLWPYFVGGLLPGLAASAVAYGLLRPIIAAYQAAMRARRAERAGRRQGEAG
ncbi:DUF2062 domain-containing protein [Amaricoccus sp.]|uniref:DUF2062 domain-containing protein n=1 Tax=Amaricoccus sp. TaxID=1872485 RepID=UPI001B443034|nr:DUF2062 domain-containing protein [Amaricoccus sp.]MBP7002463.1 DUF2062 domain-containing protein [Amaricoccus sp.]